MKLNILLFVLLLAGCQEKKEDNRAHDPAPSTEVTLTAVRQGFIESVITLSASTIYQRKTILSAPVPCYIVRTQVSPGDLVRKGQTLFLMESKESRALGENQGLEKLEVKASQDGLVTDVMQQTGSYTPEGTPLCVVADLTSMVFELNVPYEQQHHIHKGSTCEIVLPDETRLKATLEKPLLSVDGQNQTGHYIARARHPFLPEGLVVQALVTKMSGGNTYQLLPKEAVQCDETMTDFWVMDMSADSLAVKIPVTVGNSNAKEIEILSPVLNQNNRIICSGSYGLTEGSLVTVVER